MASLKGNVILNGINTITAIIFPVVTFPYAARVLLPDGIGAINFLGSIINYIVLLTSIGIPMYAVKEIAKYREDRAIRDKITVEIICLSTLLCLLGYIAVWLLAIYIPQIHQQATLFYILSLTIVFTSIGVNWFYQGIEDFKFITIRAVIIRVLAAAALFVFVRDKSDLLIYGVITVGSTVGNNFVNFVHLRRHIQFRLIKIKELRIFRHLKPALHVFILNLIISLYVQLNSIMLGFMSGDEAVGYFAAGTKISHVGLTIITSLGAVMLPRCAHLIKIGDHNGFNAVINKSLNVTMALSLPMTVGLMILAAPVTMIFCGKEYLASISVLYLNAPVIVFISLTNLMGIQVLYPKDKVNIVILSVAGGSVVNIILNFILIPPYGVTGAAVATLLAELAVLLLQIIYGRKYYPFKMSKLWTYRYIVASFVMGVAVYAGIYNIHSEIMKLVVGFCIGMLVYPGILMLMKDALMCEIFALIKNKITNVL